MKSHHHINYKPYQFPRPHNNLLTDLHGQKRLLGFLLCAWTPVPNLWQNLLLTSRWLMFYYHLLKNHLKIYIISLWQLPIITTPIELYNPVVLVGSHLLKERQSVCAAKSPNSCTGNCIKVVQAVDFKNLTYSLVQCRVKGRCIFPSSLQTQCRDLLIAITVNYSQHCSLKTKIHLWCKRWF